MRRLLPLLVVGFLLVGVGASPALADHRTDGLVFDGAGDLTPAAKGVLRAGAFVPIQGYSSWFLTTAVTINGTLIPAGTQLTTAQATHVMSQSGGLAAVAQNASVSGAPANAISPARQTAASSVIEEARRSGRVLPALKGAGALAVVAAGSGLPLYMTALKMEIPGQGALYRLVSSGSNPDSVGTLTNVRWRTVCASGCNVTSVNGETSGWNLIAAEQDNIVVKSATDEPGANGGGTFAMLTTIAAGYWATSYRTLTGSSNTCTGGGCVLGYLHRTDAQMEDHAESRPIDGDTYNNWGGTKVDLGTYNQPTYNTGDDDAMRDALNPGSQSQADQDAEDAIAKAINPAADPGVDPTTGTPNPTPIVPPATTIPGTPALDFTPLTDIDFGCKFPYGFLCYAVDVTEIFDVAPDAPRFVFDVPTVNVGIAEFGGGDDGWIVDLEVMDDWAAIWRGIWSVVIVIGAVYLVATRLLGFKAGGDPGAAMDDAL